MKTTNGEGRLGIGVSVSKVDIPNHLHHCCKTDDFSTALKAYEPAINSKIDLLVKQMKNKAGTTINITKWSMFFTFDTMGAVGFGKQFQMLDDGAEHSAIKGLHEQMTTLGILSSIPWFLSMVGAIPGLAGSYALFTSWCGEQVEEKKKVVSHGSSSGVEG